MAEQINKMQGSHTMQHNSAPRRKQNLIHCTAVTLRTLTSWKSQSPLPRRRSVEQSDSESTYNGGWDELGEGIPGVNGDRVSVLQDDKSPGGGQWGWPHNSVKSVRPLSCALENGEEGALYIVCPLR